MCRSQTGKESNLWISLAAEECVYRTLHQPRAASQDTGACYYRGPTTKGETLTINHNAFDCWAELPGHSVPVNGEIIVSMLNLAKAFSECIVTIVFCLNKVTSIKAFKGIV